jgi:hypothetical protein
MYAPMTNPTTPTRRGPGTTAYTRFATSYEYHFESAAPFGAVRPTIWTGAGYA